MFSPRLLSILRGGTVLLLSSAVSVAHAQSATAATASQEPAGIDQIWQKASGKYDSERAALLKQVDNADHQGPFRADWESLQKYEVPEWYKDAKFGIFIHWGVYSVPAFGNEWYPRNMYVPGSPSTSTISQRTARKISSATRISSPCSKPSTSIRRRGRELFKEAGAKYVVPVAEHHDGFAMYDSGIERLDRSENGPAPRHHRRSGAKPCGPQGCTLALSSHRVEHNFFLGVGRTIPSDVNDPQYAAFYGPAHNWLSKPSRALPLSNDFTYVSSAWADDWLARGCGIVEKYHPDIVYFDWWIGQASVRPNLTRLPLFITTRSLKYGDHVGVINYKDYAMQEHSAVLDLERGQLGDIRPLYWQTDTSVSNKSWGYIKNDTFKSPEFVVHQLIDIVSKNGNLLLNIGPRSDGTIPEEVQQVLLDVGAWLNVNGEAIYGTRPWRIYGEGPTKVAAGSFHDTDTTRYTAEDFRFTTKGDVLYAIGLGWPTNGEAVIHSLASTAGTEHVRSVILLGSEAKLQFEQRADGLRVRLPDQAPAKYAYALRIVFDPSSH